MTPCWPSIIKQSRTARSIGPMELEAPTESERAIKAVALGLILGLVLALLARRRGA